jgi:hypothetical protein
VRGVGQLDGDLEDICAALSVLVGALMSMLVVVGVGVAVAGAIAIAIAIGGGRCGDVCSNRVVSHGLL